MSLIKTSTEIDSCAWGRLLSRALKAAVDTVAVGAELQELNIAAERVIVVTASRPLRGIDLTRMILLFQAHYASR